MRGTHIVVTCWFFVEFCVVSAENSSTLSNDEGAQESKDTEEIQTQRDHHIFLALIDVVFTDYSKQICTGTIIHDYVVITAAHCFVKENSSPELTLSFVVIGTKKMFASGYEHYLPIERYKIHPKFNGWKADLVLVYTFAAMTSDKPGKTLKLAVEKVNNPMDSPVIVLSWGQCGDGQKCNKSKQDSIQNNKQESKPHKKEVLYHPTISYHDRSEEDDDHVTRGIRHLDALRSNENKNAMDDHVTRGIRHLDALSSNENKNAMDDHVTRGIRHLDAFRSNEKKNAMDDHVTRGIRHRDALRSNDNKNAMDDHVTRGITHLDALRSNHNKNAMTPSRSVHGNRKMRSKNETESSPESGTINHHSLAFIDLKSEDRTFNIQFKAMVTEGAHLDTEIKSYFSNWRRKMGPQQNNLTVETFGFVDLQACKKIVDEAMSEPSDIMDGNDFVCYSSNTHFLNSDDAGAPVVRQGRLYAVTITGVESNDEHVGIGLRMACYCSWIADNLPSGGSDLNCCKDCCDLGNKFKKPQQTISQNKRNTNRYVRLV